MTWLHAGDTDSSRCIKACTHRWHIGRFSAQQSFETRASTVSAVSCSPPPFHPSFDHLFPSRYASPETPLLFGERGVSANVALIELEEARGEIRQVAKLFHLPNFRRIIEYVFERCSYFGSSSSRCTSFFSVYSSTSFELPYLRMLVRIINFIISHSVKARFLFIFPKLRIT